MAGPLFISLFFVLFFSAVAYAAVGRSWEAWLLPEAIVLAAGGWIFYRLSGRWRRRRALLRSEFPPQWAAILEEWVGFYRGLDAEGRARFHYDVQCFLAEKRITGIKTEIDDTDRLLVAASAVIPIFGFKEWEYTNLNEVLLYPYSFGHNYNLEEKAARNIRGMVGTGPMNNMMILSRPDLREDFQDSLAKSNVGIHEFVHLLDKSDGDTDGMPVQLIGRRYALPWMQMMQEMTQKIAKGKAKDINPYAATGREEFFAVTSEYFFERPAQLREKHPELYRMLSRIFRQSPGYRLMSAIKSVIPAGKSGYSRNMPCPCGSGKPLEKCCGT